MSILDRIDNMSSARFILVGTASVVAVLAASVVVWWLAAVALYQYSIFVCGMVGLYITLATSILNFFMSDTLLAIALINIGSLLFRTRSLLIDGREMTCLDRGQDQIVRQMWVRFPRWFTWGMVAAGSYVIMVQWTSLIVAALVFLLIVAVALYGQIYFRNALRYFRMREKSKLEKLDQHLKSELSALKKVNKDFKADMPPVERRWFRRDGVSDYAAKLREKSRRVETRLAKLEMLGV